MGGGKFESLAFKVWVPGFRFSAVGNAYMRSLLFEPRVSPLIVKIGLDIED